jgi:hypothetical protein
MAKHLEEKTVEKALQKAFNDDTRTEFKKLCDHGEETKWITVSSVTSNNECEKCLNEIIENHL